MIIQCNLVEPCGLTLLIAISFVYNERVGRKSIGCKINCENHKDSQYNRDCK